MSCKFLVLLKMIIFVFYMLIDSLEVLQQLHCGCSLHVDLEGCLLSGTRFVSESFFILGIANCSKV